MVHQVALSVEAKYKICVPENYVESIKVVESFWRRYLLKHFANKMEWCKQAHHEKRLLWMTFWLHCECELSPRPLPSQDIKEDKDWAEDCGVCVILLSQGNGAHSPSNSWRCGAGTTKGLPLHIFSAMTLWSHMFHHPQPPQSLVAADAVDYSFL